MEEGKLGLPLLDEESRIEELEYILAGVMHSVDKWLEGDEFEQDEVNRAATMREKVLRIIEEKDRRIHELCRDITMLVDVNEDKDAIIQELKKGPKHGHWFLLDECANAGVYCSVCRKKVYKEYYANVKPKSKFCPNCGAVMDGAFVKL